MTTDIKWSRLFWIGSDLDQAGGCSITLMMTTMKNELKNKCMSSLMEMTESRPAHVLYLWHLAYKYDILHTVRQQLWSGSSIDGDAGPSVGTARSMK